MKTMVGITSFGGLPFLELAVRSVQETAPPGHAIMVVAARPGDYEMREWLAARGIGCIAHDENKGFPASINDLYDAAFVNGDFDNLIIMGNDVVAYPGCIDSLIYTASLGDWEWVCASQFDVKGLCDQHPEQRKYFDGDTYAFNDFSSRPWEVHRDFRQPGIEPMSIRDVRNLALFRRSVFDKLGYSDVNFWPNGYFEDNDYALRALLAGIVGCTLPHAAFFHFWSRTIHQGVAREHGTFFQRNEDYYVEKWGGRVDAETKRDSVPLRIESRAHEPAAIARWAG